MINLRKWIVMCTWSGKFSRKLNRENKVYVTGLNETLQARTFLIIVTFFIDGSKYNHRVAAEIFTTETETRMFLKLSDKCEIIPTDNYQRQPDCNRYAYS